MSSSVAPVSATATGASFTGVTVMSNNAWLDINPSLSFTV